MGKNIAELVVKMKNETSLSVETMGDSTFPPKSAHGTKWNF